MRKFEYEELRKATQDFSTSQIIGRGSHGCVYKGSVSLEEGDRVVAIKRWSAGLRNLKDNSKLENEARILSSLPKAHNVVTLLGTSHDTVDTSTDTAVVLVMEFIPNGSLHDLLHTKVVTQPSEMITTWEKRAEIALAIAKALQFIHNLKPKVIHRDIKSTNILFDHDWNPKLIDFGLAVTLDNNKEDDEHPQQHGRAISVLSQPAGTIGYLDPSYTAPSMLSTKNDVFSFGVVLLEIITGQKAIDTSRSTTSLIEWVIPLIKHRKLNRVFDQQMTISGFMEGVMLQFLGLAARCVAPNVDDRPTSDEIVSEMENCCYRERVRFPIWVRFLRGFIVLKRSRRSNMTPKKRANVTTIKCVPCQKNDVSARKLLLRDILSDTNTY